MPMMCCSSRQGTARLTIKAVANNFQFDEGCLFLDLHDEPE